MAEHRKTSPRPPKTPVELASDNGQLSVDDSQLSRFIRDQVGPISEAFSQTPLTRLRVKTTKGAVTLVKARVVAPAPVVPKELAEGARARERLPHAARIHNPETGRAYDTISSSVVGIFRDLPEPPATGDRLSSGQILGHIEALRLRNAVRCPLDCTLIAQVVVDGQPVDFGEALFVIDSGGAPLPEEPDVAEAPEAIEPPRL